MQARYYDPVIGRFYSNDPVGFRDVHSFNRYAYANNNPYAYTDPDGNSPVRLAARFLKNPARSIKNSYRSAKKFFQRNGLIAPTPKPVEVRDGRDFDVPMDDSFDTDNPKTSNPLQGEPGSCSTCNNKNGKKKQKRYYGEDGYPDKDVDFDHSHGDQGSPHTHEWDRPDDGSAPDHKNRQEPREPTTEEIE